MPLAVTQGAKNGIQNVIQSFGKIRSEEPQHKIAMFLKQRVFATVAPIGLGIG